MPAEIRCRANVPQGQFLAMPQKFRAFVAGYGCVRGDTLIYTEFGLERIDSIDSFRKILSRNPDTGKNELCNGGPSFIKGKARLFEVVTADGSFIASGDHRVMLDDGEYIKVGELAFGNRLFNDNYGYSIIIDVIQRNNPEQYWDIQVDRNHNYITPDGTIHHNSGKTWVGSMAQCQHFYQWPKVNQGYFAPSYPQIRDIFYPTIEEVAHNMGLNVQIREGNKEVHFYSGKQYRGTTICRSMDRPGSIVGFKIGHALVDELDVMSADKARDSWRKIIARMRYNIDGLKNGVDVTTTPEGFRFTYEQFKKAPSVKPDLQHSYGIIQASTKQNAKNLPVDYIQSLYDSYPLELIDAYIDGQFTNLNSGSVYTSYDKDLNNTDFEIEKGEVAHVGMDFNVGNMAAVIHVERGGKPYAVDEIMKGFDTPDMIIKLKEKLWDYVNGDYVKTRKICIYPDASGKNRKSVGAQQSDTSLLEQAGFSVIMNPANPPVKDRVNAMNKAFCNASGERFYHVNKRKCPEYSDCLEQQPYKNGEPSKDDNQDHAPDAGGYYIAYKWPIHKPVISTPMSWAM